jgi:tetratricopeptide (TPR) repeat protein
MVPHEGKLAIIIKVGRDATINDEYTNYTRDVKESLPPHIFAVPVGDKPSSHNGWAAICYLWAGGFDNVEQIKTSITRKELGLEDLSRPIITLMENIFNWYIISATRQSPFGLWEWTDDADKRILATLKNISEEETKPLIDFIKKKPDWGSRLGIMKISRAKRCHGDVNYCNILFSGRPSACAARIIDFGSIKQNQCPAYDWAKFERDIRLKCIHDLYPSAADFSLALSIVDRCLEGDGSLHPLNTLPNNMKVHSTEVEKIIWIILSVRKYYSALVSSISGAPRFEYLFFLLSWSLAYLDPVRYPHDPSFIKAIIHTAISIYRQLESAIEEIGRDDLPNKITEEVHFKLFKAKLEPKKHGKRRLYPVRLLLIALLVGIMFFYFRMKPSQSIPQSRIATYPIRPKILVFELNSSEPQKYQFGSSITTRLREAKGLEDIDIDGWNQVITKTGDAGTEEAVRIGREQGATAVIWGYVSTTKDSVTFVSFDPVDYSDGVNFSGHSAWFSSIPFSQLEGIKFRLDLSAKLTPLVMMATAWDRFSKGDLAGFERIMDEAVRQNPAQSQLVDPAYLYDLRALSRGLQFNFRGAISDWNMVLHRPPTPELEAQTLAIKSLLLAQMQYYDDAAKSCTQLFKMPHPNLGALHFCIETEWLIGDEAAARRLGEQADATPAVTAQDFVQKANIHLSFCAIEKARSDINNAQQQQLDPGSLFGINAIRLRLSALTKSNMVSLTSASPQRLSLLFSASDTKQGGQRDLAISMLKRSLTERPSIMAHVLLASFYEESQDHNELNQAISHVSKAIELGPSNARLYWFRASLFEEQARLQDALDDLTKAIKLDPTEAVFRLELAQVLFRLHQRIQAQNEISIAIKQQPTYSDAYALAGDIAADKMNWKRAYDNYTKAINQTGLTVPPFGYPLFRTQLTCPSRDGGLRQMSLARYFIERIRISLNGYIYASVENDLKVAHRLAPNDPFLFWLDSRWAEEGLHDYTRALAEIEKAINRDPSEGDFYSQKAQILIFLGKTEDAIAAIDKALSLNRGLHEDRTLQDRLDLMSRATLYNQLGRYHDTLADYNTILKTAPHDIATLCTKGNVLLRLQLHNDAITTFVEILKIEPDNICALTGRATANMKSGNLDPVPADLDHLIRLAPQQAQAYSLKAEYYEKHRDFQAALKFREKAAAHDRNNAFAWWGVGLAYEQVKQYDKAVQAYLRAIAIEPKNAIHRANVAGAYLAASLSTKSKRKQQAMCQAAKKQLAVGAELNPQLPSLHLYRAELCLNDGSCMKAANAIKALDDITFALKAAPESPLGYFVRAEINQWLGNWDRALADASIEDALSPAKKGQSHRSSLEAKKAAWLKKQAAVRTALSRDPDNPILLEIEAETFIALGDPVQGLDRYKRALQSLASRPGTTHWHEVSQIAQKRISDLETDPRIEIP